MVDHPTCTMVLHEAPWSDSRGLSVCMAMELHAKFTPLFETTTLKQNILYQCESMLLREHCRVVKHLGSIHTAREKSSSLV